MAMNLRTMLVSAVVVAILVYLAVLVTGSRKTVDGFTGTSPEMNTFTLYYMNGCPHCESILPEYKDFAAAGQIVTNGKKTKIRMLEQGDPNAAPELAANNVKGFPTFILMTAAGESLEYSGDRTVPAMKEFIAKNAV
jgi:protein-disulfide isomerase